MSLSLSCTETLEGRLSVKPDILRGKYDVDSLGERGS